MLCYSKDLYTITVERLTCSRDTNSEKCFQVRAPPYTNRLRPLLELRPLSTSNLNPVVDHRSDLNKVFGKTHVL